MGLIRRLLVCLSVHISEVASVTIAIDFDLNRHWDGKRLHYDLGRIGLKLWFLWLPVLSLKLKISDEFDFGSIAHFALELLALNNVFFFNLSH